MSMRYGGISTPVVSMPSRFLIALIVLAWLATMSWMFYREWWPQFQDEQNPPFTVELADEATPLRAFWTVYQGDKRIGRATTTMVYRQNDTFDLVDSMTNIEVAIPVAGNDIAIKIPELTTVENVTRSGKLVSLRSKIHLSVYSLDFSSQITATVKENKLYPVLSISSFFKDVKDMELAPVPLKAESMWNPMYPHAKIRVRPGNRWRVAAIDPLGEALKNCLPQIGPGLNPNQKQAVGDNLSFDSPKMLNAEVLREPQEMMLENKSNLCYVIEYRDADDITQTIKARTWIRTSDWKVLRQEAISMTDQLRIDRDE